MTEHSDTPETALELRVQNSHSHDIAERVSQLVEILGKTAIPLFKNKGLAGRLFTPVSEAMRRKIAKELIGTQGIHDNVNLETELIKFYSDADTYGDIIQKIPSFQTPNGKTVFESQDGLRAALISNPELFRSPSDAQILREGIASLLERKAEHWESFTNASKSAALTTSSIAAFPTALHELARTMAHHPRSTLTGITAGMTCLYLLAPSLHTMGSVTFLIPSIAFTQIASLVVEIGRHYVGKAREKKSLTEYTNLIKGLTPSHSQALQHYATMLTEQLPPWAKNLSQTDLGYESLDALITPTSRVRIYNPKDLTLLLQEGDPVLLAPLFQGRTIFDFLKQAGEKEGAQFLQYTNDPQTMSSVLSYVLQRRNTLCYEVDFSPPQFAMKFKNDLKNTNIEEYCIISLENETLTIPKAKSGRGKEYTCTLSDFMIYSLNHLAVSIAELPPHIIEKNKQTILEWVQKKSDPLARKLACTNKQEEMFVRIVEALPPTEKQNLIHYITLPSTVYNDTGES